MKHDLERELVDLQAEIDYLQEQLEKVAEELELAEEEEAETEEEMATRTFADDLKELVRIEKKIRETFTNHLPRMEEQAGFVLSPEAKYEREMMLLEFSNIVQINSRGLGIT